MITEKNSSGTYTAFQRLAGSNKVGVICEADTIGAAMGGCFEQVVKLRGAAGVPSSDNPFVEQEVGNEQRISY